MNSHTLTTTFLNSAASSVSLWFTSYILGFFYQANIFSCLIAVKTPIVPHTLKEAVNESITLFTSDQFCFIKCSSTLIGQFIPDLLLGEESKELPDAFLRSLLRKTKFVNDTTTFAVNFTLHNTPSHSKQNSNTAMFGLIDTIFQLRQFSRKTALFNPKLLIIKNHDLLPFNRRSVWLIQRSVLSVHLSNLLSGVVLSGLYNLWQHKTDILSEFESLKNSLLTEKFVIQNYEEIKVIQEKKLFNWLNGRKLRQTKSRSDSGVTFLAMNVLKFSFQLFGILSLANVFLFFLEKFLLRQFTLQLIRGLLKKILKRS